MDKRKEFKADMLLLLIAFFWGLSYLSMDVALKDVDVFNLNVIRFLGAFVIVGVFSIKRLLKVNRQTIKAAVVVGACLAMTYVGATAGLKYTTISNSAFLCSTTVLFVPFFDFLFFRKKTSPKILIAVFVAAIGIALMTLKDDFSIDTGHLKGDLISLTCGIFYAMDLVWTQHFLQDKRVQPFQMGLLSIGVVGILMIPATLIAENPHLPKSQSIWMTVIFLTIFCTAFSFIAQPIAQMHTETSHAGIILSMEPVFASMSAFLLAGEVATPKGYLGQAILILTIIFMELDTEDCFEGIKRKFGKRKPDGFESGNQYNREKNSQR